MTPSKLFLFKNKTGAGNEFNRCHYNEEQEKSSTQYCFQPFWVFCHPELLTRSDSFRSFSTAQRHLISNNLCKINTILWSRPSVFVNHWKGCGFQVGFIYRPAPPASDQAPRHRSVTLQSPAAVVSPSRTVSPATLQKTATEQLKEHDKELKASTQPPNSTDPNTRRAGTNDSMGPDTAKRGTQRILCHCTSTRLHRTGIKGTFTY